MALDLAAHLNRLSVSEEGELEAFVAAHETPPGRPIDLARAAAALAGRAPAFRQAALRELALADLEIRWDAGQSIGAAFYLNQAPELGADPSAAVALVLAECLHRRAHGKPFTQDQLAQRYPEAAAVVWPLLQAPADTTATADFLKTSSTVPPAGRASPSPALPEAIGPYRILRELGRGGMGRVFLAEEPPPLKRKVALKVAILGGDSPQVRERFVREVQAAAAVTHRNLCPIYSAGESDGMLYYVMGHVAGETLARRIERDRPNPVEAVRLARRVALALEEPHRRGIVHRDLKPGNIVLDEQGEPVVLDWGLARSGKAEAPLLTQTGDFVGTLAYAPPEQVRGEVHAIGLAADIYSLGAILYELLTGRRPFEAPTQAELVVEILMKAPAPPSSRAAGLDPRLDAACLKALAKAPGDRYPSMAAFAAALEAIPAAPPALGTTLSAGTGTAAPAKPASRRRRWWLIGGAAAAATAACIVIALIVAAPGGGGGKAPAPGGPKDGKTNPPPPAAVPKEPRFVRAFQHDDKVEFLAVSPNKDKHVMITRSRDGVIRLWDWDQEKETPRQMLEDNTTPQRAVFSPDGRLVVIWTDVRSNFQFIWDYELNKKLQISNPYGFRDDFVFSPDGQRLLVGLDDGADLINMDGFAIIRSFPTKGRTAPLAMVGDKGEQFLTVASNWPDAQVQMHVCVQCWDATLDSPKSKDKRPPGLLWEAGNFPFEYVAAFSPDCKKFLISCGKENALHLWDFEQSKEKEVRKLEGHKFPVTGVAFSPDGKRAASSSLDKTVRIWDVESGKELWKLEGHTNDVTCVAWLPDGRHVVSGSTDKTVRLWEIPD